MDHGDYSRIASAIRYLDAHADEQPSLADLAAHAGLSEHHFHRMFRRWSGITPKDFLQVITLIRAKGLLAEKKTVLDTSLAVGLSGSSRLHDLFLTHEAMTPGEFKAAGEGVVIDWGIGSSPFGEVLVAVTARGICALDFVEGHGVKALIEKLQSRWPRATLRQNAKAVEPYLVAACERMLGKPETSLSLLLKGTPFQVKVWEALLRIPPGQVVTYQKLAALAGTPAAVRAVGTAIGANPIAYLIPCHRVIRATGAVGEYRWGAERKEVLLAVERASRR